MKYYNVKETASRIRALRIEHGYTQAQAAKMLYIDRCSLSHIENGSKGCSIDILARIASVYSTSLDYLIFGKPQTSEKLKKNLEAVIPQLISLHEIL
jgi:transcriptional regulator with XRE-family HTH domain